MSSSQGMAATSSRLWRWIGELGIAYSVLYFLGLLVFTGNQPGINAGANQLIIGGFLVGLILQVALLDAASHHITSAARTLNVLSQDDWVQVVGLSIVALSTGFAGLRGRVLPRWLAVASIALGVLALAGPLGGIAFLLTPLWTPAVAGVPASKPGPPPNPPAPLGLGGKDPARPES